MDFLATRRSFLRGSAGIALTTGVFQSVVAKAMAQPNETSRIRRNASLMQPSDPFFADYADAVRALHELALGDVDGWRTQALIHLNFCPHGASDFCAWHRHYISFFETLCGELIGKPDFALAYWDWSADGGKLPVAFFADGPLNVTFWNDPADAQSDNWPGGPVQTVGTRALNINAGLQDDPIRGGAFTAQNISQIQRLPRFDLFQSRLEGSPHNNGHVVSGAGNGHIGNGMSPLDPAFWLHHCNVDRIWAEWQAAGNETPDIERNYDGQFVGADGNPITDLAITANSARDFQALGFTYDTLSETLSSALDAALDIPIEVEQTAIDSTLIRDPSVISAEVRDDVVRPFIASDIPVNAPDLIQTLFSPRGFRPVTAFTQRRVAVEETRILARLSEVRAEGQVNSLVTNVFVNCPYLSPETPYTDPHFADSFAFFMPSDQDGNHHDREFVVDITEPIRLQAGEGRISTDDVVVQLMPVATRGAGPSVEEASFTVGKIEIIAT
jgi:tyrosinase